MEPGSRQHTLVGTPGSFWDPCGHSRRDATPKKGTRGALHTGLSCKHAGCEHAGCEHAGWDHSAITVLRRRVAAEEGTILRDEERDKLLLRIAAGTAAVVRICA